FIGEIGSEEMVGNAVYYLDPKTNMAEIAFIVRGDWQKKGVATLLLSYLTIIARERNIRGFWGTTLYQNRAVINILKKVFNNYYLQIEMPQTPAPDEEVYFQIKFEKE
ncbi:MAG: acetyl-CoA hydrolase/transferase, partial [Promethearchaeota archaeon CR_4]